MSEPKNPQPSKPPIDPPPVEETPPPELHDEILPGGVFPELTDSWAYKHSQVVSDIAAGQTVVLPKPAAPETFAGGGPPPPVSGITVLEGPGGAYSVERRATLAWIMMQQQTTKVAAKLNPWQY